MESVEVRVGVGKAMIKRLFKILVRGHGASQEIKQAVSKKKGSLNRNSDKVHWCNCELRVYHQQATDKSVYSDLFSWN